MTDVKKEEITSVKLTVAYQTNMGNGSNDFNNLQELKKWLDKNPKYAEALGYNKK